MALVAVLALGLLAACGDDDDDEATDAPTGTGAASESAGPTDAPAGETIKLGFSAWPGWFPWQVTEEKGIFEEVGVDVELVWFEGYLDSINAFAGGQLDANTQTLNDTIPSVAAGSDQRIVLVNDNSTGNDAIIVSEGINSIEDLAGKTIGIITNAKEGTKGYFTHLERLLREELGVADVVWRTKSNYSAPADAPIVREITNWHAVFAGVGD